MKLRYGITCAAMTICFMAAATVTAFAAPAKGKFEDVTDTSISGYAYDNDKSEEMLAVEITVTKESTGEEVFHQTLTAGEYRESLPGNGCHGFTLEMDWSSLDGGTYLIEGSVEGRKFSNTRTYDNGPEEEAVTAQSSSPSLVSLGVFKTTGYCPCRSCSAGWGRSTHTGAVATSNHTIAVDPRVIPYGTRVMINGIVYTAEDRGGGVKGNHIDIFYDNHTLAKGHGAQHAEVFLVQS